MIRFAPILCCIAAMAFLLNHLFADDEHSERNGHLNMFDTLDVNGDGTLTRDEIGDAAAGVHLVIGAKGDPVQLVLNTLFHVSLPIENVPWDFFKAFAFQSPTKVRRFAVAPLQTL